MEKGLSQAQRDHLLLTHAKDDAILKKQMVDSFERSNLALDQSITKMTNCLSSLGEGIASGMQMLAVALSGTPPQSRPPYSTLYPPHYQPSGIPGNRPGMFPYQPQTFSYVESESPRQQYLHQTMSHSQTQSAQNDNEEEIQFVEL